MKSILDWLPIIGPYRCGNMAGEEWEMFDFWFTFSAIYHAFLHGIPLIYLIHFSVC